MARNGCYFTSERKKENELLRFYSLFNERGSEKWSFFSHDGKNTGWMCL